MFDIGWSEMVVIGIVALIAIGPKELPTVLRTMGQWMGKIRRMAGEFQGQFQDAMREAEIADLKKQFDDAASSVSGVTSGATNFDPLESTRKTIESAFEEKPTESPSPAATDVAATPPTSEAVPLPPPDEPVAPPAIDVAVPEPAPLDSELAPKPAPQPPKESGA